MSRAVAIRLDNVGFYYPAQGFLSRKKSWVLQGVSFEVYRGETLGVIGRNGAGKSTLMKLLAGMVLPDQGTIESHVGTSQLLSVQVGFVNELTGRENVILSGLLLGMARQQIASKMDSIIEFSELEGSIDEPLRTYSSGMRARLGFAISCQADPELLIIDEALGVGDSVFRNKSKRVIFERMKSDRAFVLVSHNEGTILDHCERAVWIEAGQVRMIGSAPDVIGSYRELNG